MKPLHENPDFKNLDEYRQENSFRDINGDLSSKSEVYGTDALDQAIEAVIITEPYERIFNLEFWSPFYKLLFEDNVEVDDIIQAVVERIERFIDIRVDVESMNVKVDNSRHSVSLEIPYYWDGGKRYHIFSRVISKN